MMKLTKDELRMLVEGVKVKSASNPSKTYTIKLIESPFKENKGKLILYCTCPSWKFGGKTHKRVCKHIKQFLAENVHPNTRRHLEAGIEGGLTA